MRKNARELLDCVDNNIKNFSLVSKEDGFEPWAIKVMDALSKRGERVVPVTGMGKLDFELEKLKEEGVDLFHRCIATKDFVSILNVLTPKKRDAV